MTVTVNGGRAYNQSTYDASYGLYWSVYVNDLSTTSLSVSCGGSGSYGDGVSVTFSYEVVEFY